MARSGGQGGLSFVGEPMVFAAVSSGLITLLLLGQFNLLSCDAQPDPQADFRAMCAQADVDRRSGAEEYNAVILADDECIEYLMWQEAQEQQDRAEDLEVVQPVEEAQP